MIDGPSAGAARIGYVIADQSIQAGATIASPLDVLRDIKRMLVLVPVST